MKVLKGKSGRSKAQIRSGTQILICPTAVIITSVAIFLNVQVADWGIRRPD